MELNFKNLDGDVQGGYNVELLKTLPEKLTCPLCEKLMQNPLQTCRGECACFTCYSNSRNDDAKCPLDGDPISPDEIFLDRGKAKEIKTLGCFCFYKKYGCLWQGTVGEVEEHIFECRFIPEKCPLCNGDMLTGKPVEHLNTCPNLLSHECTYRNIGCKYKPTDQHDLLNHLQKYFVTHSILAKVSTEQVTAGNIAFRNEIDQNHLLITESEFRHQSEVAKLMQRLSILERNLEEMKSSFQTLLQERKWKEIEEFSKAGENVIDHKGINSNELNKIQNLTANLSTITTNMADLDLRQQISENTSYDGRIVWKIDRFKTRLQQAITGKITALHSAPGFTQRYGTKFCARLYLNGDGMGKCTHMSLFFVVMRSEYDSLVQWPFSRRVTFRLINQEDQSKHLTESFYPDRNSSSFQKPTKEMNIAAGCPLFLPKEQLFNNGFVKDDSIFIEILTS